MTWRALAALASIVCGSSAFAESRTPAAQPPAAAPAGAAGAWSGSIKLPGMDLKIQVLLEFKGGAWSGSIDIPMQGAKGLQLEAVEINDDEVSFRIAGIPGEPTFSGKPEAADRIAGDFSQGGASFPFELSRGELAKAKRPQQPAPPFPYAEEQVTVSNGEVSLAGTFTLPPGDGPFPAVILVSGSGPQNRDEEIFEHRPFAVWADHLTRAGIAVLRYDDRGVGDSTGDHTTATTTMLSTDTEAWVGFLKRRGEVGAVGILGHSEGGIIAPMVAARNNDVAFIVMLAGPGVSGAEVLIEQNRALMLAAGADDSTAEQVAAAARPLFESIIRGEESAITRERMIRLVLAQSGLDELTPEMEPMINQQMAGLDRPWFSEFLRHDPADDLRKVRVPVLALFGERDAQVVPAQNVQPVVAALQAAGNESVTVKVIPGTNHMFQPCTTGSVQEYAQIETTIDPSVLNLVRDWILANSKR
ncbi:MAG: alpha/beta fold hydrolase [Phycisphaeraceae bacterium]|nr:alpha/beta fold hydrolase [Phycisphaeraceae bacterium]